MFLSGAQRIYDHQKLLNKINVFPVADADTGTNLASTMRSIMEATIPTDNLKQTAVAMADAALTGARGNSGIIFAQFLYGFSNEISDKETLDIHSFAESMKRAVIYAYEAIANPVEGTILTVIKDWANYLDALKDLIDDFIRLLVEAYKKAVESLADTPNKLEVLARSHVVDAGAKGFVVWLEGIVDSLIHGDSKIHTSIAAPARDEDTQVQIPHDVITFRYCTEALIHGKSLDKLGIRETLSSYGDSLVVAGSNKKVRVHLHTDAPAEALSLLQQFGDITFQKVDDMVMEHEILVNRKWDTAILTDSSCDLPEALLDRYQIHVVPLSVHFGASYFLDRITINPSQFYQILERSKVNPSSSQPATKDFQNKYDFLCTHYQQVIGIHISQAMSGTFSNSEIASRDVALRAGKEIRVLNSRSVTAGLGLIVLRIAREFEAGKSYSEVLSCIDSWIKKTEIRVTVPTLKYIIRSGRVSHFKSFIARMLDLKPIISVDKDGKAYLFSKSFTMKGSMEKVVHDISRLLKHNKLWEYAITHADNPAGAEWYQTKMEQLTGKRPVFVDHASPALVANTGPGVVCVSLVLE
jgi:DegV family protein with EDD domain